MRNSSTASPNSPHVGTPTSSRTSTVPPLIAGLELEFPRAQAVGRRLVKMTAAVARRARDNRPVCSDSAKSHLRGRLYRPPIGTHGPQAEDDEPSPAKAADGPRGELDRAWSALCGHRAELHP